MKEFIRAANVALTFTDKAHERWRYPTGGDESGTDGIGQGVVTRPLLVATIQRLPQRTIESIRPTPGILSPTATFRIPSGPSNTAVLPRTSLMVQPSIVVGRVSGVGVRLGVTCMRGSLVSRILAVVCAGNWGAGVANFSNVPN